MTSVCFLHAREGPAKENMMMMMMMMMMMTMMTMMSGKDEMTL